MSDDSYREALRKLNERERQILELKCQGLTDEKIWGKMNISEGTYNASVKLLYVKLGLDLITSYKERKETIKKSICHLLSAQENSTVLESVSPEPSQEELSSHPEVLAIILQDRLEEEREKRNEIVVDTPNPIIKIPVPKPRIRWDRIFLFGFLVLLFLGMAGTIGYLLGNKKPAQQAIVVTATPNQQMTKTALAIPVVPPTSTPTITLATSPTIIPTDTIVPTDTEIPPTDTPVPSPTPEIKLPFTDNFDSGMNSNWVPVLGTWRTVNGQLTADPGGYSEISVGDGNWTNYAVDVDVFNYDHNYEVSVIVRDSGSGSMILRTNCCDTNWILVNGIENKQIAHLDKGGLTYSGFNGFAKDHFHIEVSGNNYTAYIDGKLFLEVQDSTLTNGRVGLGFSYPSDNTDRFDNFKVSPLP